MRLHLNIIVSKYLRGHLQSCLTFHFRTSMPTTKTRSLTYGLPALDRVNRLVLSINQKVELLVDTGMEPGELTFRFWNILDGGHPDSKLMKKLLKRKKRNFVFTNCILFSMLRGDCV